MLIFDFDGVLINSLDEVTLTAYNAATGNQVTSPADLPDRTLGIYEARSQFIAGDPQGWLALHRPYQPLWDYLRGNRKYAVVILTNKNRDATLRLCRHFGLGVQAGDVYSGDHGAGKVENMRRIQKRFPGQSFGFIDDSVKNLRELENSINVENRMIRLLLASWGYTGPRAEKTAQQWTKIGRNSRAGGGAVIQKGRRMPPLIFLILSR